MKTIIIETKKFGNIDEMDLEFKKKFTKKVKWIDYKKGKWSGDAINDFLWGGFGVFEYGEEINLIWLNNCSENEKKKLFHEKAKEIIKEHKHINFIEVNC